MRLEFGYEVEEFSLCPLARINWNMREIKPTGRGKYKLLTGGEELGIRKEQFWLLKFSR
jgi:hypothetical protein